MVIGCCICGCREKEKWKGGIPTEETLGSDGYFHSLIYSNHLSFVYICDIYQIVHCKHVQFIVPQLYLNKPVFFFFYFLAPLIFIYLFIYFLAVLGLRFCARASSSYGKRGPLFIVVRGPLTIAASLVAEHRLQTRRLSSSGSRAQLLRSMWDLPGPGLEPVSPALAGRFSTTAPPGKPSTNLFLKYPTTTIL